MIRDHTLQILIIEKGVNPGSIGALLNPLNFNLELRRWIPWAHLVLLTIPVISADSWTLSFPVPRLHHSVTSLCHIFPRSRSCHRDLTGWLLSSPVLPPPDTSGGYGWPFQPCCDPKRKPSVAIASTKPPILSSSTSLSLFVLSPTSF
jgi:hypothetical protein